MKMTRAAVLCGSSENLLEAVDAWLSERNMVKKSEMRYMMPSRDGEEYLLRIPCDGCHLMTVVVRESPLFVCCVDGRVQLYHIPVIWELRGLDTMDPKMQELAKELITRFGGCWIEDDKRSSEVWICVEKGQPCVDVELSLKEMLKGAAVDTAPKEINVPDTMTWLELFECLGKVIDISDFGRYASAAKEFRERAGRTNVFG